jgi:hypothetical protein
MDLFKRQFILSKVPVDLPNWNEVKINDYTLKTHPTIPYTFTKKGDTELHLIGDLYDWVIPFQTNQQILDSIKEGSTFESYVEQLDIFTGQFVLIIKIKEKIVILSDACAQSEIYYDTTFSVFASQPKLICRAIELTPHQNKKLKNFFLSKTFRAKGVFFGELTHVSNVKHLRPNHHIDISQQKINRHFPCAPARLAPLDEAAGRTSVMLRGYLKAIAHRYRMAMAVTAGYDSRVLFISSLELPCLYFVQQHKSMNDNHCDITIPQQLALNFDKEFTVIADLPKDKTEYGDQYTHSIDFPRFPPKPSTGYDDHIYVNGNISKIARNHYGYHKNISAKELAFLSGFKNNKFAIAEYQKWIDSSKDIFEKYGYNLLDMFYWEEKMGNWAAKAKTEGNALGFNQVSPFNSLALLSLLLSSRRELRDSHNNVVYNRIIELFEPSALSFPINPGKKHKVIQLMKSLKIYNLYWYLGVKFQLIKI